MQWPQPPQLDRTEHLLEYSSHTAGLQIWRTYMPVGMHPLIPFWIRHCCSAAFSSEKQRAVIIIIKLSLYRNDPISLNNNLHTR